MRTGFLRLCMGLLLAVALLPAAPLKFYTVFGPEATGATGTGYGSFEFNETLTSLTIDVEWSGLSGVTTVAHIHCCTTTAGTGTVGVAVTPGTMPGFPGVGSGTLGVSAGSYSVVLDLTQSATFTAAFLGGANPATPEGATARLLQGILDGKAYFNIHSTTFPGGEIRGFLAPVPEPGTFVLSGLGVLALLGMRRLRTARARG
jgi:hypothetical protein